MGCLSAYRFGWLMFAIEWQHCLFVNVLRPIDLKKIDCSTLVTYGCGAGLPAASVHFTPTYSESFSLARPRIGELRTQKLNSHLARTLTFNVLLLKPVVGQYKAIHATLTARNFLYPSGPFTCIY